MFLYGKNSVFERLNTNPQSIKKIFLAENFSAPQIEELIKTKKITIKDVSKKELFKIKDIKTKVNPVSGDKFPRPARRPMSSILQNTRFPKLRNYAEALKEYLKK